MVGAFRGVYVDGAIKGGTLLVESEWRVVGARWFMHLVMVDDGDLRAGSVSRRCVDIVYKGFFLATRCNDSSRW